MKIGIFGGAFDPLHIEHIKIIKTAKKDLSLDKLILLPSCSPPHKSWEISPFEYRLEFLLREFGTYPDIIFDTRENGREVSYSYKVLAELKEEYPDDELIYIIGGDSMEKFHTWVNPEVIAKIMPIAVAAREGYPEAKVAAETAREKYGADIRFLTFTGSGVSSSVIKAGFELGIDSDQVTDSTKEVISEKGMYKRFLLYIEKVASSVSPSLFEHMKGTVMYAMKFAAKLALNYDEIFIAALLHDCAKEMKSPPMEGVPPKVLHQFYGAEIAEKVYGITNENILDAIRYHTTGKVGMSNLGKLIYCADMLEENRDYEGVDRLRKIFEDDFEAGFLACIESSIKKLERSGKGIYFLTENCYNYYNNQRSDK